MEYIENTEMEDKTITIFTDSQVTLDALRNNTNHTFLIEAIRKKGAEMSRTNWEIQFCWVKAHVGTQSNELADTLAKEAATNMDLAENYKKIPECTDERANQNEYTDIHSFIHFLFFPSIICTRYGKRHVHNTNSYRTYV